MPEFLYDFAFKTQTETEHGGVPGLLLEGYASKFNLTDLEGETLRPGALAHIAEEWGDPSQRQVLFHHGMDGALGSRVIGKCIDYRVDDAGLWVRVFVPKSAPETWNRAAKARFADIYGQIKRGVINGFSVAGVFTKSASDLLQLAMQELSITPRPCLPQARFVVGAAAKALLGEYMSPQPEETPMNYSRAGFSDVMRAAQKHGDGDVHDLLLSRPSFLHGAHDADSCPMCSQRRSQLGIKATTKTENGQAHPASHYLVATDPAKPSTWHLRVRDADGNLDTNLLGAAHAALLSPGGHRGNRYAGPDRTAAVTRLRALYKQAGLDWPAVGSGQKASASTIAQLGALTVANQQALNRLIGQKAGKRLSHVTRHAIQRHLDALAGLHQQLGALLVDPDGAADDDDADAIGERDGDSAMSA